MISKKTEYCQNPILSIFKYYKNNPKKICITKKLAISTY